MTKKKIFVSLLVLTMMMSAFSFAMENEGIKGAVANILQFDTLTGNDDVPTAQRAKVKRKEKVSREDSLQFMSSEDLKGFQSLNGVISNSMVVEQARRDIGALDTRFEDLQ